MRNLKRVLSLALASAMLLGMMVMGAGAADKKAADLTDMDKVVNKEAVSLLVDLGVIAGKDDGTYAPTEIVDRATMAKLVYFVLEGNTDANIYKGGTALKDVTGHWAEGFINYCYSLNIIAGDGAGSFLPANKVTTVAAAKMLLVALGYDAVDRGYVNDAQWSINIMKDAQKTGLMDDVAQKTNEELTRDNAAQMIFNALMANTVIANYDRDMGEKYISSYTTGNTLGYETYSLVKVTAKVDSISEGKAVITTLTDAPTGIVATNVTGKVAASTNVVGQNVSIYVKASLAFDKDGNISKATFKDIYSSSILASTSTLLATSAKGLTIKTLTSKKTDDGKTNKEFLCELSPDKTVEGNKVSTVSYFLNGGDSTKAAIDAKAAKGVVIEFYDVDGDGLADVVKVLEKKVTTLTADPKTKANDDGDLEVLMKGAGLSSKYVSATGYEDMAKDDVVLYYVDNNDVYHFELANSFNGKVTAINNDGAVRVDGTYRSASGMAKDVLKDWSDFDNEYTFYTDNGGYVVKAETTGEKSSDKYAIVLESAWVSGGGVGASKYMEAKVLLSDGTTQVVKVSKIDGKTVVASTILDKDFDDDTQVKYTDLTYSNGFYTYTVKDEKYQLTATTKTEIKGKDISATAQFDKTNTSNSKTVFIVEKGTDTKTYTTYTGFSSLPSMTGANGVAVKDGSVATYVFLTAKAFTDDAPDGYVYLKNAAKFSKDSKGNFGYDVFDANGDEETLWVDEALATDLKGIVTVGALTDGIATKANVKAVDEKTGTMTAIGNDIVEVNSKVYTYDADTIFVVVDVSKDGKTVTAGSADPSNYTLEESGYTYTGYVIANSSDLASYIYLVATEA